MMMMTIIMNRKKGMFIMKKRIIVKKVHYARKTQGCFLKKHQCKEDEKNVA
jgi:hypothetical protein